MPSLTSVRVRYSHIKEPPGAPRRRLFALAAAVIGLLLVVTACSGGGGSGPPAGSASASGSQAPSALAFAECMRKNGVPNFPDPDANGQTTLSAGPGSGLDPTSPAFKAAQQACASLRPGGAADDGSGNSATLKFAECMRKNGVPNFPDPTDGGVLLGPDSGIDPDSPAFKNARQKCQALLPSGAVGGGQ